MFKEKTLMNYIHLMIGDSDSVSSSWISHFFARNDIIYFCITYDKALRFKGSENEINLIFNVKENIKLHLLLVLKIKKYHVKLNLTENYFNNVLEGNIKRVKVHISGYW